jgi:hypothetical protein
VGFFLRVCLGSSCKSFFSFSFFNKTPYYLSKKKKKKKKKKKRCMREREKERERERNH